MEKRWVGRYRFYKNTNLKFKNFLRELKELDEAKIKK